MRLSNLFRLGALAGAVLFASLGYAQRPSLTVYTALETDQLKAYEQGFPQGPPDIEIKWVRDSTGCGHSQTDCRESKSGRRRGDGVAASSLALLDKRGMLEPYAPAGLAAIQAQYRDKKSPPPGSAWTYGVRPSASTRSRPPEKHPEAGTGRT